MSLRARLAVAADLARPASARCALDECLAAVDARDASLRVFTEREPASRGQPAADGAARTMPARGALNGWTFTSKDMFACKGLRTRYGCGAFADAQPDALDAAVIALAKGLGAVHLGKVAMTELALYQPAPTKNPFDETRTAGGSSCGSAVSVATGMAHFSLGSQTGGSVIRPASFNGVVGVKPTWNSLPMNGALSICPSLDTIGLFTRAIDDAAVVLGAMTGQAVARPKALGPGTRVGVFSARSTHYIGDADACSNALVDCVTQRLARAGVEVVELAFPPNFDAALATALAQHDSARSFQHLAGSPEAWAAVSAPLRAKLEEWKVSVSAERYRDACAMAKAATAEMQAFFDGNTTRVDFVLAPSARGVAPPLAECLGSDYPSGDPWINSAFTMFGNPCVSLPVGTAEGMPLGVQLVGQVHHDMDLLAQAQALVGLLDGPGE